MNYSYFVAVPNRGGVRVVVPRAPQFSGPFTPAEHKWAVANPPPDVAAIKQMADAALPPVLTAGEVQALQAAGQPLPLHITLEERMVRQAQIRVDAQYERDAGLMADIIANMSDKDFAQVPSDSIVAAHASSALTDAQRDAGLDRLKDLVKAVVPTEVLARLRAEIAAELGG